MATQAQDRRAGLCQPSDYPGELSKCLQALGSQLGSETLHLFSRGSITACVTSVLQRTQSGKCNVKGMTWATKVLSSRGSLSPGSGEKAGGEPHMPAT